MAVKPKLRTIVEPIAESAVDSNNTPIKSLALSKLPDGQTLIYAGTVSGAVLLYSLLSSQSAPPEFAFIKRISLPGSASGGSVNSIHPLVHNGKVIVVSNGFLFLLDSSLLEPAKKISLFKGVTAFSRKFRSQKLGSTLSSSQTNYVHNNGNSISGSNLFAVGIGKKLVLAELVLSGSLVIQKEIQGVLDGIIVTLLWVDDAIFVGTKVGYYLYNCVNGQCGLIFSLPDSSIVPRLKLLTKESRALLMVDNVGIIVDMEGQPVGGSLVFKEAPDSLGEIGSYVVAARNSMVELYHKKTGRCVQRFIVDGNVGGGPCVLADEENQIGKLVAIATSLKLICYGRASGEEQIKDLLRKKNFKEAISLVDELENEGEMTKEMLCFVHAQVGFLLLFDLHFKEAVDHFLLSETMQPSELFPFIMRDPNRWTLLRGGLPIRTKKLKCKALVCMVGPGRSLEAWVPRNRYWGLHPPPTPLENVVDDGLTAIQRAVFLKKAGVETAIDDEFLLNPPSRADLLESAIENMIRYLQACRERDLTVSVREGVDTLLMYLYRALNRVEDMERLASSENSCIVCEIIDPLTMTMEIQWAVQEELEALLNDSGHLRTLAFLYAGKGMGAKALSIWRILARSYSSNSYPNDQSEETGLQDSSTKFTFGRDTAAIEACKILEESSDQDLVLQHLGWIADINQVLAVQILISDKRINLLSPGKTNDEFVLDSYLEKRILNQLYEVIAAIDPKKVEILQRYLQWLIEDQDSDDTQFHTAYAILLAKSALENYELELSTQDSEITVPKNEMKASELGRSSIFDSPVRERFQIFLQSSDLYDAEEVLYMIEESELWLEKAILYRKLGQETLVLQILAFYYALCYVFSGNLNDIMLGVLHYNAWKFERSLQVIALDDIECQDYITFIFARKLENCEAAEEYCAEIGRPDAYMQLLEMYLDPKDGREPMFKAAVRLLHNYGEMLDPLQVLEVRDLVSCLALCTILLAKKAQCSDARQWKVLCFGRSLDDALFSSNRALRLSLDMPLQLASDTILKLLRARLHHHHQGQIMHNLSRALDVDANLAILEERSRHVLINDESVCDSCHARLGTKLFAMYPDDTIVCYKCYRRQGESTSVTGRDFKEDVLIKPGWLVTR
ncbi:hypothetical protein BUALT_Bualt03G0011900 [Buddleja alternifolia]|uniref:CNH domain-containing protein n=1 Tax=Buddleja alternifolia TaxID=168488 RepID=A0AAV6XQ74_9LAMI|nr:hypothetical protein BUALT_Bualt03G0011900 [Buddleja alternifolia]